MAKVWWNPLICQHYEGSWGTSVYRKLGTHASLSWHKSREDRVNLDAKYGKLEHEAMDVLTTTKPRTRRRKRLGPYPGHPMLKTHDNRRCPCHAWKYADAMYQTFSQEHRDFLRRTLHTPGTSIYDAYMKQTIPHLISGMIAPYDPAPVFGAKLHQFIPYNDRGQYPPDWRTHAYPPQSCQTRGLYYVTSACKAMHWPPEDPTITHWDTIIYAEAYDFGFDWGTSHLVSFGVEDVDGMPYPPINSDYFPIHDYIYVRMITYERPAYIRVLCCPPRRTLEGKAIHPLKPDLIRMFGLEKLTVGVPWSHWPQLINAPKGTYRRMPKDWPPFPEASEPWR